jgi:hypothetical protein
MRGTWPFGDQDLLKRLAPIMASHHEFWGDAPEPFLVTVLPLQAAAGSSSVGGTALGDAFAFFASPNVEEGQLTRVLAHEHLHNWIPRRVGLMPEVDDTAEYWFSEGFADFYAYRLLARDRALTVAEFAKTSNDILWRYGFSSARNAPNSEVIAKFWTDREVGQLPYRRGYCWRRWRTIAFAWRPRAVRFDDVMFGRGTMLGRQRSARAGADAFVASMKKFGVDNRRHRPFHREGTIVLPDVWGRCGGVSIGESRCSIGFDGHAQWRTATSLPASIRTAGLCGGTSRWHAALAAGLGEDGDSRVPLIYRIVEKGNVREIRYLPAGRRRVSVQELRLDDGLDEAGRASCAARLAGLG